MPEEQKQIYPDTTVGAIIYNDDGKVLLLRGKKFGDGWLVPGGHVEVGETLFDAIRREVKEETNLDIDNIEFLQYQDAINPEGFVNKKHYIFLDFAAHAVGGEVKFNEEFEEYDWFDPKKVLTDLPLSFGTRPIVTAYLENLKKGKHGFFNRECKNCEKIKKDCAEYKQGWQRALADYKNLQAETEKRRGEWAQYSEQQILEEFIPVYDHLKMSIAGVDKSDAWVEGVKYVLKQFADILKNHGVEEIKTVGEMFDPTVHEAAGEEHVEGGETGKIIKEIMPGYKMRERVIRAAKVIVVK